MKDLSELIQYRIRHPQRGWGDSHGGCFKVQSPLQKNQDLFIIA